jgi:hypothetical protein
MRPTISELATCQSFLSLPLCRSLGWALPPFFICAVASKDCECLQVAGARFKKESSPGFFRSIPIPQYHARRPLLRKTGLIDAVFGQDVNYATETKQFARPAEFLPLRLTAIKRKRKIGEPDMESATTCHAERTNLSVRTPPQINLLSFPSRIWSIGDAINLALAGKAG